MDVRHRNRLVSVLLILTFATAMQALETLRFPGGLALEPLRDHPLTLVGSADGERYSLVTALREEASGARIVLDPVAQDVQFSPRYLRALGAAASVELRELPEVRVERPARTLTGQSRQGSWTLLLDADRAEPVETLLVVRTEAGIEAIDAALVPSFVVPEQHDRSILRWLGPRVEASSSTAWPVAVDTALVMWLLLIGGLLLPARGLSVALRIPLALLAGAGLVAGLGVLHLPGVLGPLGATLAALGARRLLARRGVRTGWSIPDAVWLGGATLVSAALATLVRSRGLLIVSPDSFDYWTTAYSLAGAELTLADLDLKRPAGLAAIHSPGFTLGAEGLLSLDLIVAVAGAAMLMALPRALGHRSPIAGLLGAALAGLALSSAQLLTMALYLNTHVLVAALLLLIAVFGLLDQRGILPEKSSAAPVTAALMGLVMLRAEAILLVGLVVVGTIAMSARARRADGGVIAWDWAAWSSGAMLAAVGAVYVFATWVTAGRISPTELLIALAGIGIALSPSALERIPLSSLRALPAVVGTLLWSATAVLLFTRLGDDVRFLEAARINLWEGAGRWGMTAPIVFAVAAAAVLGSSDRTAAVARWTVIGFVPSALFAKLLDGSQQVDGLGGFGTALLSGGGRVGWGDSVNRMWTHVVLVVLLLALVAALEGLDAPTEPAAPRSDRARWFAFTVVGALAISEVMRWQPPDLGPIGPPEVVALSVEPSDGRRWDEPVQFPDGAEWSAALTAPTGFELPDRTRRVEICVDFVLSSLGTAEEGAVEVDLIASHDGEIRSVPRVDQAASQRESSPKQSCLRVRPTELTTTSVSVHIRGTGGPVGESLALVPSADGTLVRASVAFDAPSTDPRPRPIRFASALLRAVMASGPVAAGITLLVLLGAPRLRDHRGARPSSSDR